MIELSPLLPEAILAWYDENARDFPWRGERDPYRIWISEIMLQQTRAETVVPYYRAFLDAYPDVRALADANLEAVLKQWEGLGYYSRARNLHAAAQRIVNDHGGTFPHGEKQIRALPGIGEYTAGAIQSIAFSMRTPALDGNQMRVLTRVLGITQLVSLPPIKQQIREAALRLLPVDRPGDFNVSLMNLGALICLPKNPKCGDCPARQHCTAHRLGVQADIPNLPPPAKKKQVPVAVALIRYLDKQLVRKRPEQGLLGGLWEFPCFENARSIDDVLSCLREMGVEVKKLTRGASAEHVFTHRVWKMTAYEGEAVRETDSFVDRAMLSKLPMSSALHSFRDSIESGAKPLSVTLIALNAHHMHTNLALRQLIPGVVRAGFCHTFFETHINQPHRKVLERIGQAESDLAAFSCYIWNIDPVLRLCRSLKKARPEMKIALGGPEVSFRAEELLKAEESIDFILSGEGERSLPALLGALRDGKGFELVPGLAWRAGQKICIQTEASPLEPDSWEDPYEHGIAGLEKRILYIETSRGCPYSCQYCLSSARPGVRALSADESIRRLTKIADQGASLVKLVDRTFNFDPARANAIWRGLIDHRARCGTKCVYHFEIGAQLIDEEALGLLRDAPSGLFQMEIGIQSSDERVLAGVNRHARFVRVREAVMRLRELRTIPLHVDLIAGLPGEDMATFARSFDDAYALLADMLQLGFLKLLHGSGLRRDACVLGLVYEPDPPYEVVSTDALSFSDLCHLKDVETLLDWYSNSGRYKLSMRYLTGGQSAFGLFSAMATRFRVEGLFDAERAEKARATALVSFKESDFLSALIRHDLLASGRRADLPDALAFTETSDQRALLREAYHPVRGQSAFEYPYDVFAFERDSSVVARDTLVLYDAPYKG